MKTREDAPINSKTSNNNIIVNYTHEINAQNSLSFSPPLVSEWEHNEDFSYLIRRFALVAPLRYSKHGGRRESHGVDRLLEAGKEGSVG